jgi:hypothetical protein
MERHEHLMGWIGVDGLCDDAMDALEVALDDLPLKVDHGDTEVRAL